MIDLNDVLLTRTKCLITMSEESWLWHRCLVNVNLDLLNKMVSKYLVIGLPKIKFSKDHTCDACRMGNQTRVSFKSKNIVLTYRHLELIHMDTLVLLGQKS